MLLLLLLLSLLLSLRSCLAAILFNSKLVLGSVGLHQLYVLLAVLESLALFLVDLHLALNFHVEPPHQRFDSPGVGDHLGEARQLEKDIQNFQDMDNVIGVVGVEVLQQLENRGHYLIRRDRVAGHKLHSAL